MDTPYKNSTSYPAPADSHAAAGDQEDVQRPLAAAHQDTPNTGQTPASLEGAPPSNTAPSNRINTETGTRVLRTDIDSLYLSYGGELKPEVEGLLEALKRQAQREDPLDRAEAIYRACDHRFEVKDKGKGRYPFVLQDGVFHLQLSRRQASALPMVYAQISSEVLTRTGAKYTEIALNNLVSVIGNKPPQATVSRVDLCADFITDIDLEVIPRNAWINRATKRSSYEDRGRFSGLTFGMGGSLSARLYDKTLEILRSGKTYLYDFWRETGWDGKSSVWRLEFQYSRQILHEFGITSVADLLDRRAALWHYATTGWLRFVIPSVTDNTKDRWPNHPLWDVLSDAAWGIERGEPLTRSRKSRLPSEKSLFVNGIGAITSYMACEGISDFDEGLRRYANAARAYHLRESRRTGKTLPTYAREKAQCKARRFNTLMDSDIAPALMQSGDYLRDSE